ncbi:MAG: amidohydrolase [Alphaproteobacteria bacterium]|nr:amidohydrolase [Alphaproteobacteria bacterium]
MEPTGPADLIVTNGKIATLDASDRVAQALAIKGDRFQAVGRAEEIERLAGPETRRIDAGGKLVVPGLIDGHAHLDREGLKEILPSLSGCRSIADVLDRIREIAARTPKGEWIVTMPIGEPPFYQGVPENLAEARFPTRQELDTAAPDHPVYIRPIWGHWRNTLPLVSVANTLALERAGITRDTMPPAPSVEIGKDPLTGEPNGSLREFIYKPLVEKTLMRGIPRFTLDDRIAGLKRSMEVYNSLGTTSVFEGHGVAGEVFAAYQHLREEGPLPVRSQLMFSPAWLGVDAEAVRDLLVDWGRWLARRGLGDAYLRMAGIYTESDYSEENRLRALCGPYTGWAGFNFDSALPEDVMIEMMVEAARNGIRVGSFSPRILELYEQVHRRAKIDDQRWIIEHIGMFTADEIKRVRDLGLVLQSYSTKWIEQDGEALRVQLGEDRVGQVLPLRDLVDAGVHVSLATDNVPPSLFVPIGHAVSRLTEQGRVLGPDQKLSRMEALAAASREGAWLSFEEDEKGTIEPGKLADLAVLSEDLLEADEARIPGIVSDLTVTGGRVVFDRDAVG